MSTRIGLISDVHSSPEMLAQALAIFADEQVDEIICAGDIAGYYDSLLATVELLQHSGCKAIVGNHDQAWLEQNQTAANPEITAATIPVSTASCPLKLPQATASPLPTMPKVANARWQ